MSRNVCHGSSRGKWEVALCWGHRARAVPTQARVAFPAPLLLIHRGSPALLLGKKSFFALPGKSWLLRRRMCQEMEDKCLNSKEGRWSSEGNH